MWTTPTPFARRSRMIRNSSSISVSVSAAVGSSITRTAALSDSALAISTICCWAILRSPTRARGSSFRCRRSISSCVCRLSRRSSSRKRGRPRGSRPRKMFWATVRCGARFSSWWIMLMPRSSAVRGLAIWTGSPLNRISPASGWYTPARIFIRVDLPAPFSPTRAWTSPGWSSKLASASAWTPGKSLVIPVISTSRSRIGSSSKPAGLNGTGLPQVCGSPEPCYPDRTWVTGTGRPGSPGR